METNPYLFLSVGSLQLKLKTKLQLNKYNYMFSIIRQSDIIRYRCIVIIQQLLPAMHIHIKAMHPQSKAKY